MVSAQRPAHGTALREHPQQLPAVVGLPPQPLQRTQTAVARSHVVLANAVNTATGSSSLLPCQTNSQPRAPWPRSSARAGSSAPCWRNPSTKHNSGSRLVTCKFGVKFYLPHALLCTTKHPNICTSKLHKHTFMTKELLHGLRLTEAAVFLLFRFVFCPLPLFLFK